MHSIIRWSNVLFGSGDDDYPFWLLTVRVNILVFVACAALALWHLAAARQRRLRIGWQEGGAIILLTAAGGLLRFCLASANLMDFGGIPYSRLLWGYRGYFATAQFLSPGYQLTSRDIEHGILFLRIAGTLTIPLVYALCRRQGTRIFPAIVAFLFAVYPLHIMFSASDALVSFTTFLAASSFLMLIRATAAEGRASELLYFGGLSGVALLTQVRPENALFLVPAAVLLLARRQAVRRRELAIPLAVSAAFVAVYAVHALTAGLAHRNPIDVDRGMSLTIEHLLLNPFSAIPLLLMATAAVGVYGSVRLLALAVLPWGAALVLCVLTIEDGHGAARIYTNWLILILPAAGYGLSLLCSAPQRAARFLAVVALICFTALPIVTRDRLAAQHLEIAENNRFKEFLAEVPREVERIIVPDDELMWREHHSTLELFRKYAAIFSVRPAAARRLQLVALTDYLENPEQTSCAPGACVFFFGIPCMDQDIYAVTRRQCDELLQRHRTSLLADTNVVAAPFVACSIYIGEQKKRLCDPATASRGFKMYRIED